jgi:hypothetical protein
MLALDFINSQPHGRFFTPLFATLRSSGGTEGLRTALCGFLDSERVNTRTDDDKSLLLAIRVTRGADDSADISHPATR